MKEGIHNIVLSKNKTFLAFCFSFLIGVALCSWFSFATVTWLFGWAHIFYCLIFALLFLVLLFRRRPTKRFFLLVIIFFLCGCWRVVSVVPNCHDPKNICYYNGKTITFTGWVAVDPDKREDKINYYIQTSQLSSVHIHGLVLVQAKTYQVFAYGDTVSVHCKIEQPKNFGDGTFQYDKYLADQGAWAMCGYPKMAIVIPVVLGDRDSVADSWIPDQVRNDKWKIFFMKPILAVKNNIALRITTLVPEPEASFLAGILYGSKAGLPKTISDNFSKTGITHIIAVSGFNITIIATALMGVLIAAGLWRRQAFWGVLLGIWLFTILSGLSASAVRAVIMGTLALTAEYIGRQSRIGTSLVATAAIMTLINPYVFLWDAGFQLSFLATIGLVYVSPVLNTVILNRVKDPLNQTTGILGFTQNDKVQKAAAFIYEPLLTTLSAIIATTPLIMYQFGRLSLVAPLVNVLVLWIVPWLMLAGFITLVLSYLFFPLSQLAAAITTIGLKYVIIVANFFGSKSWSAVSFQLPWWGVVILYCTLIWYGKRQTKIHALKRGV